MKVVVGGGVALLFLPVLFIGAATGAIGSSSTTGVSAFDIPANMLTLYISAAKRFDIPAPVLAAVGKVECDHNRNPACGHPNFAGAAGPMQFLPTTFAAYSWASGNPNPSIYDERDSVYAAAAMLAANGIRDDVRRAIYSYNHSWDYVDLVLGWAEKYATIGSQAMVVVETARSYLGVPYLWGGESREGMDCSGLVLVSYAAIGVSMPRVAQDQAQRGVPVVSLAEVQPGDLISYGSGPASIDHITIASGNGKMIEAPHAGAVVREVPLRTNDLVGIRRMVAG